MVGWLLVLVPCWVMAHPSVAEQALDSMQSYEAEFVQVVKEEKLFREEKSTGKVWVQRPGKFFWRYDTGPQLLNIISDGLNLWIDQPTLKQVMVQSLDEIGEDMPITWLASDQPIAKRYHIRALPETTNGLQWYDLQNKNGGSQEIAFIELGLDGQLLKEVRLTSSDGKVTSVQFKQAKRNHAIPPSIFIYKPAVGTDIIGTPR
jgi:outer membrane lipoprotein carrier protein